MALNHAKCISWSLEKAAEFAWAVKIHGFPLHRPRKQKGTERRQVLLRPIEQGGDKDEGQIIQEPVDLESVFLFYSKYSRMLLEVLEVESDRI